MAIITKLKENKYSIPFLQPVNTKEYKNYSKIIKTPMDLSTIENMLNNNKFISNDNKFDTQHFYDTVFYYYFL